MNIDQDRHMLMVDDNVGNQFKENAVQNVGHLDGQNAVQNQGTQNVGNQNGLSIVSRIANQHGNGNVVAARARVMQMGIMIERVKDCTLKDNLQQASTSEEQYTELLEPIPESHQVPRNDSNVIFEASSVEQSGGTVEQHPAI
ncbi:hypothetical protein Tco_0675120 [Tanacetum coccineum]